MTPGELAGLIWFGGLTIALVALSLREIARNHGVA